MFRPAIIKKTAGVISMLLLLTLLTPILAFAATGFDDIQYQNGTVTGIVYSDDPNAPSFIIEFFDSNENRVGQTTVADSTYLKKTVTGVTYWKFTFNPGQYYNKLVAVTEGVYSDLINNSDSQPGSGGGFWGIGGGGSSTGNAISIGANGQVNASTLSNALNTYSNVILNVAGESVVIPASALVNANGKTITVVADHGATYTYPIDTDLLEALAEELGSAVNDMSISIDIEKVAGSLLQNIQDAANEIGATLLADAVDFKVTASASGNSIEIENMGQYVNRTLPLNQAADASKATGVVYDPASGTFRFVPSTFSSENNNHKVSIDRQSNSIYTVIDYTWNFADVTGHWAQSDIQLLTNKLIVNGMTATSFEPESQVTRAQFAALIVRALGLNAIPGESSFSDVHADDWFAGEVNAAAAAGIVDGYPDGTFQPNAQINREELAAMVVRALSFAGIESSLTPLQSAQLLSDYTDAGSIVWAQNELAIAIDAGIVNGMTATTLAPRDEATRAQAVTMIKRFLSEVGFIN